MNLVLCLITAFTCSLFSIQILKPLALKWDLVDRPCARKHHDGVIPLVGGIAVFVGVLMSCLLWLPNSAELNVFIIASALMVFIGALDDRYDLSVRARIVGQVLVASLMIFGTDTYIHSLGNLFGLGEVKLGSGGILFTYVAVLAAINAFNMVDGIDGLIGSLSIVTFTSLAILFLFNGGENISHFPLIIVFAMLPYLAFNLGLPFGRLKKIFMGDAGSMFIGFSVVWLLALGTSIHQPVFRPVTALWIIAVPLMDMTAIMYRRYRKGQSMFKPDREHLHHIFMRAGFSARQALGLISIVSTILAFIGIAGEIINVPSSIMLFAFLMMFLVYCYGISKIWRLVRFIRLRVTLKERARRNLIQQ